MTALPQPSPEGLHDPRVLPKSLRHAHVLAKRAWRHALLLVLAVLVTAASFLWWSLRRADQAMREDLLVQARLVAKVVSLDRLKGLTGTDADLQTPDYLRLKEQLARTKEGHNKCRFIYLTGRRADGRVFFFVDNEPVGSEDESPAGQIFEEASPEFLNAIDAKTELVEGPVSDRWGTWVSALVPIIEPRTGELVAMLGMDIDAGTWNWDVAGGAALPASLMLAFLIVLASAILAGGGRPQASATPVQRRLLAPLTAVLLLLVAGFGTTLLHLQRRNLNQSSREKLAAASHDLEKHLDEQSRALSAVQDALLRDQGLTEALRKSDGNHLFEEYQPLFTRMRDQYGITHFYFHRPDRVNLLRVHKPAKSGDLIERFTAVDAEQTGNTSSGIELGPLGTFTLRVVRPVFDGDTLIGYLELGKEIEDVLEEIRSEFHVELVAAIRKSALTREAWETGMRMLGREAEWDRFADNVIIYTSLGRLPKEAGHFVGETGHTHSDPTAEATFANKTWRVLVAPLIDASGAEVGDMILYHDISEERAAFHRLLAVASGLALVLLTALIGFLYVALKRVDRSILAREADLAASERLQRTLTETSPDFIFIVDRNMTIRMVNRVHSGHRKGDVVGRSALSFVPPEHQDGLRVAFARALETRELQTAETRVRLPNGEGIFLNRLNPLPGGDEEQAVVLISTDITERKRAEEARNQAKEAAEASAQRATQAMQDMERINAVMMGREERVLEMKQETNSLLAELGRARKYEHV